jgi:hypothetical protein
MVDSVTSIIMRMKHVLLFILMVGSHLCFSQSNKSAGQACTVAGQTEKGELGFVCRQVSSGTCYRLSGRSDAEHFHEGVAVWIAFRPDGVQVTDTNGHSVSKLLIAKTIPLNSRQWPWFGPVSEMVCRAGKENSG